MKRRHALATALCGLTAFTQGCGRRRPEEPGEEEAAPVAAEEELGIPEGRSLVPVEVDPAMEIRTITGLRPFRPSGFVVRRDEMEGKTVVHNYGHGGGGITLSWGSSELALRLAGEVAGVSCGVIGGGVMGLSTARLLQLHGAEVTLYTRDLPPETTSNIAGAQWWPVSVFDSRHRTEAFGAQFVEAAQFSHRYFQNLVGPRWGVRWLPNYYLSDGEPANGWLGGPGGVLHHLQVGFRDFGPGEHVFPSRYVRRFHSMLIEPATYLSTLLGDVQGAGGRIVIRHFPGMAEVLRLPHPVLFNCSGLGSRELAGDAELIPVKGQLSVLAPQPEVNYNLITDLFYMFPRTDGIILGGTFERGKADLEPDPDARRRILEGHRKLFEEMARNQRAAG